MVQKTPSYKAYKAGLKMMSGDAGSYTEAENTYRESDLSLEFKKSVSGIFVPLMIIADIIIAVGSGLLIKNQIAFAITAVVLCVACDFLIRTLLTHTLYKHVEFEQVK